MQPLEKEEPWKHSYELHPGKPEFQKADGPALTTPFLLFDPGHYNDHLGLYKHSGSLLLPSIVGLVDKKADYNAPNSPSLSHTLSFSLLSSKHRYNIDVLLSEDK